MKLSLGFSPCPNDTFIFDALVNGAVDTGGLSFEVRLEDVETLNQLALDNTLDISKISYGVLPALTKNYVVLNSGSALGSGVGPLLINKSDVSETRIREMKVAIPGEHTTAHILFSLAYPGAVDKIFLRYNEIEDYVLQGRGAGVIIHENRFTYGEKGLVKIRDLGEYWEQQTGAAIPLGGIVGKRSIDPGLLRKVDGLVKKSIEYSFSRYPVISDYVRSHSQEMEDEVMRKHIDLYVNNYSLDLGGEGRNAIRRFLKIGSKEHDPGNLFL